MGLGGEQYGGGRTPWGWEDSMGMWEDSMGVGRQHGVGDNMGVGDSMGVGGTTWVYGGDSVGLGNSRGFHRVNFHDGPAKAAGKEAAGMVAFTAESSHLKPQVGDRESKLREAHTWLFRSYSPLLLGDILPPAWSHLPNNSTN